MSLTGQRLAPTQHHTCHVSEICFCSSDDSEDDGDDEWRKTPMGKRIKNARQSLAVIISSEKSKSFVIIEYYLEFVALFLKFFTNSKCPLPQVAGDKRKRVTAIKEEEEEDEDGESGKPVKKRSSQAGGII